MVHTMKDQTRESTRRRRNHAQAFKDDLIAQSLAAGASVSAIAMKGGINANLLFKWRREHVKSIVQRAPTTAVLMPVCIVPGGEPVPNSQPRTAGGSAVSRSTRQGVIEIEIAGAILRLRGAVDEAMLTSVLRALRQNA
jgi:transposase